MKLFSSIAAILSIFVCTLLHAAEQAPSASPENPFGQSTNVNVLLQPTKSPLVTFRIMFLTGSAYDPVGKEGVADQVASYGQVIVDECHHLPAVSFERVLNEVKARYVVGLTATPQRRDGHHPITQMQLGPVRYAVDARTQAGHRPFDARPKLSAK